MEPKTYHKIELAPLPVSLSLSFSLTMKNNGNLGYCSDWLNQLIRSTVILILLILVTFCPLADSRAEPTRAMASAAPSNQKFAHSPTKATALPDPGQPTLLTVTLNGSRDMKGRMHLFLVSDGILVDVPVKRLYLNENDYATFEYDITAPWIEMAYQFIFQGSDGSAQASPRYSVKRGCIPSIDLTKLESAVVAGKELGAVEKMQKLVENAKGLEKDLGFYNHIISTLEKISAEVPQ